MDNERILEYRRIICEGIDIVVDEVFLFYVSTLVARYVIRMREEKD